MAAAECVPLARPENKTLCAVLSGLCSQKQKMSSLVSIIGLFDILGMIRSVSQDVPWRGLHLEPLFLGAIIFFVICFAMSKYSRHLEVKLSAGEQR